MKHLLKHIFRSLILISIMGILYFIIEIAYDGDSSYLMMICGGLSGFIGGLLNQFYNFKMKIWLQSIIITIVILALEFTFGVFFNADYSIWDYRNLPFNVSGQICLYFGLIWFVLFSPLIIWLDDTLRNKLFKNQKPKCLLWHYIALFINK